MERHELFRQPLDDFVWKVYKLTKPLAGTGTKRRPAVGQRGWPIVADLGEEARYAGGRSVEFPVLGGSAFFGRPAGAVRPRSYQRNRTGPQGPPRPPPA